MISLIVHILLAWPDGKGGRGLAERRKLRETQGVCVCARLYRCERVCVRVVEGQAKQLLRGTLVPGHTGL